MECVRDKYGPEFQNLDAAKLACKFDKRCGKIYDQSCRGGPFALCPKDADEVGSSQSCLYILIHRPKKDNAVSGMPLIFLHYYCTLFFSFNYIEQ